MDENQVKKIVTDMLSSFSNMVIPQHTHNGVDCNRIPIQNIIIVPGVGLPLVNGKYSYNLYIDPKDFSLELLPNLVFYTDGVNTISNLFGGTTGYVNNTNIPTTGGTGAGCTVDTTTLGGVIISISINNPGSGYTISDTLHVSGGDGTATFKVASLTMSSSADFNIGEVGTPFYDVSINTTDEFKSDVLNGFSSNQFSQIPALTSNALSDGTNNSTEQLTPNIKRFTSTDTTFQIELDIATVTNYVPTSTGITGGGTLPAGTIPLKINGVTYNVLHT